ncbi:MAG: hypothetical protein E6Q88_00430 [Lysobacteraceae bacterium]|nr:MAG: hypothetical protein E6Q88_00430 [Xanthomonadaceae bacterium]
MAIKQEMFRFVSARRAERALMTRIASRLIRDRRPTTKASMLYKLFGPGLYDTKLVTANNYAASADFFETNDPLILALEPLVEFLRDRLQPGADLSELAADFKRAFPAYAALLERVPPDRLAQGVKVANAKLWDSLYAQTIRGCDRYVSTNYLVDGLRAYHVLRLLWLSAKLDVQSWAGVVFDGYEPLIDLNAASETDDGAGSPDKPTQTTKPVSHEALETLTEHLVKIDKASVQIDQLIKANAVTTQHGEGGAKTLFDAEAVKLLSAQPALAKIDLKTMSVDDVQKQLRMDRELTSIRRQQAFAALADPAATREMQKLSSQALAMYRPDTVPAASVTGLSMPSASFRVPLDVGAIKPPAVGDLLIVEQELRRYELGELAEIESIMRGERRERTIRKLNRTSQTTTTESSFEQEESSSLKTDERFQLSTQAQQSAEQSFGVEAGISVSGKFGPVQVSASVNASFDTSRSSSESTSQEYAKTVTEEATKRIKSSIKESTSVTILTETQDTSLRGFNNEKGTAHINGLYRWVDKIYDAQLVNYGKRLMLSINVPEPAAYYRGLIAQEEAGELAGLAEPVHPALIDRDTNDPLPKNRKNKGYRSWLDIDESNYADLAALYDVTVQPPPVEFLTGSKSFVHPEAMQAKEMKEHEFANDLSYVSADNTITLDPAYRLTHVSVFAPKGSAGGFDSYVDSLKMGEDGEGDENILQVLVGNKSFYLTTVKGQNGGKVTNTNFNTWIEIADEDDSFGGLVQPSIPITVNALFEGMLTFTVVYKAVRTDEAFDAWKSSAYSAIVKGYNSKKQAYDQAKALAESKAQSAVEAKTYNLRDDQYRSIELTELKRGCIDLLTGGSAAGYTSIAVAEDGTPRIVHDPAEGALIADWRAPLANGSVAEFFELAFEWENTTYQFFPYYWGSASRWKELAQSSGVDPVFEQFLRAGNANVLMPVRPGYERTVIFFLKTGLIWGGGKLPLFSNQDMLDVYADVELGVQFDPPLKVGEPWEVRVPASMIMLQEGDALPEFPPEQESAAAPPVEAPVIDETIPF